MFVPSEDGQGRMAFELTTESEVNDSQRPWQDWEVSASEDEENRSCHGDRCCPRVLPLESSVQLLAFK